jgi:hypothetical protein
MYQVVPWHSENSKDRYRVHKNTILALILNHIIPDAITTNPDELLL